ncbi:phosphopantetheine-binding protein, partial [uncultured Aquimarina sp.]|uniref:phosphopantetheine-binding protein n=1 Tax=uncultured Aquimarina sp. TaxID=575652 RepID=UPI002612FA04
ICEIWQDVLGLDRVGVTDDFFRIGGNSILSIQVSSHINKILSIELTVKELFLNTTIESICILIQTKECKENLSLNSISNNDQLISLMNKENVYYVLGNEYWRYSEYKSGSIMPMNAIIQKELIDVDKQSLSKAIDTLV